MDGDSAHNITDKKANEQAQRDIEEYQSCQGKSRLDGQPIHCNLLARCMKGPRIDECDYHRQQGSDDTCNTPCNECIVEPPLRKESMVLRTCTTRW